MKKPTEPKPDNEKHDNGNGRKKGLTCYFDDDVHHRLWVSAQIARKSMSAIVEQVMTEWLSRHAAAIDAASRALRPENLDLDP
jgi:hypothetical protein